MKESSFMIYESFYETLCRLRGRYSRDEVGAVALEMLRYGCTGERHHYFEDSILEACLRGYLPLLDKSKENYQKAVEASERRANYRHRKATATNRENTD